MTRFRRALMAAVLAALSTSPAAADSGAPKRDWRQEKCFRYARDWNEAMRRYGREGISAEFLAGNAAFIHSCCLDRRKICPSTAKDRTLADALAIRVVNSGMSTTFLPFDCPHRGAAP